MSAHGLPGASPKTKCRLLKRYGRDEMKCLVMYEPWNDGGSILNETYEFISYVRSFAPSACAPLLKYWPLFADIEAAFWEQPMADHRGGGSQIASPYGATGEECGHPSVYADSEEMMVASRFTAGDVGV
jgi:hypothetical protein